MNELNFSNNAPVKSGGVALLLNRVLVCTMILSGAFLLSLIVGAMYMTVADSSATDTSVDISVEVASVIALTTSADSSADTLSVPITPTDSDGSLGTNNLVVNVQTNNPTGYSLTMNTQTSNTALVHTTTPSNTIPSTTAPLGTPAALPINNWGYWRWEDSRVDTPTTFARIPGIAPDTLRTTTAPASSSDTTLTFAVNVDRMRPQGHYQNVVVLTATSNYVPEPTQDMQGFTTTKCSALAAGETVQLKDTRDNKVYRVRKMADERCWMIDNLAYDINSAPATGKPAYSPTAQLLSAPTGSVNNRAQYAQNTTDYNIFNNGNPTPSYLYNWCAAMGDTSANCSATVGYTAGQPATPQTGICPAPFRLPTVGVTPSPSTPGNGANQATAAATTTNEFAKLDIWLGGTGTYMATNANAYTNFTTDNTTNSQLFWLGVLGGVYDGSLGAQGVHGDYWSSTAGSGVGAYYLNLISGSMSINPSGIMLKRNGFAVRCIL